MSSPLRSAPLGLIVCTALKFSDLCCEARTALCQRQAVFTGQQVHHVTHLASVLLHLGEGLLLIRHAAIDESLQSPQQSSAGPTFPDDATRLSDRCTSPSSYELRSPAG